VAEETRGCAVLYVKKNFKKESKSLAFACGHCYIIVQNKEFASLVFFSWFEGNMVGWSLNNER